jgi:hypothetical protein
MAVACPAGHESTATDYCDTCGAPIGAAPAAPARPEGPGAPAAAGRAEAGPPPACPSCGEAVLARFCESCGYDIESGTPAGPPPVSLVLGADRGHWERMVGAGDPPFPAESPTGTFELTGDRAVLGRVSSGATAPGIDLPLTGAAADPAVSHRQCVFERAGRGWTVRDAGSANGTWINDATAPLAAGTTHTLAPGDRILMGAWTCLTVRTPGPAPE